MLFLILDPKEKNMIIRKNPRIFNWGVLALGGNNTGNLFSF